jgi:hypothetical protein
MGIEVRDEIVQLPDISRNQDTLSDLKFRDDMTATINVVVVPEQRDESAPNRK